MEGGLRRGASGAERAPATPSDKRVRRRPVVLRSTGKMPVGPTAKMAVLLARARRSSPLQKHTLVLELLLVFVILFLFDTRRIRI